MKNKSILSLTAAQLKWMACIFMLVDHIGVLLSPQNILLRGIGRLAFPIFAFMTANACYHSRNIGLYLLRLLIFALCYQPVYQLCMGNHINIFATLFLGASGIYVYQVLLKRFSSRILAILPSFVLLALAELLPIDYGAYGVALILAAYLFFQQPSGLILSWLLLTGLYVYTHWPMWIQAYCLLSIPLLFMYNQQKGRGNKWSFYIFYCLHIPALYLIGKYLL